MSFRYRLVFLSAFFYFVSALLTFSLLKTQSFTTVALFLPEGIALALAISFGPPVAVGVFLGQLAIALYFHSSFVDGVWIGFVNAFEAYIGWRLAKRWRFERLDEEGSVWRLFLAILLVLQPISALGSHLLLRPPNMVESILWWYFGNATAQIVVTPPLLRILKSGWEWGRKQIRAFALLLLFWAFAAILVVSLPNIFLFYLISMAFVLAFVYFFGILYAELAILSLFFIGALSLWQNMGLFLGEDSVMNVINFNLYLLSLVVGAELFDMLLQKEREYQKRLQKEIEKAKGEIVKKNDYILKQGGYHLMYDAMGMVAHHWRQPINNISLIFDLLRMEVASSQLTQERFLPLYERAKRQIQNLSRMLDNFSFLVRKNQEGVFVIEETIHKVLGILASLAKGREIEIRCDEKIKIYGDEAVLLQVLLAILKNSFEAGARKVVIEVRKRKEMVEIIVQDGMRIDNALKEAIFDPFASSKGLNGRGLGLYLAKVWIQRGFAGDLELIDGGIKILLKASYEG